MFLIPKNYDAAYEPWVYVKDNCPKLSIAIYVDGEKIIKHKIKTSKEGNKFLEVLIEVWQMRVQHFTDRSAQGVYGRKMCQLMYDNKNIFQKSDVELYNCFDTVYQLDKLNFTHPKSLYTYFSLTVDLYKDKKKSIQDVFNKYDDINEKIEEEVKNYSEKLNGLIKKEQGGELLTKKETQRKRVYQDYLKNYNLILENIDTKLGIIADCKNLVPLYSKGFEENKADAVWLKRAVSRMYNNVSSI